MPAKKQTSRAPEPVLPDELYRALTTGRGKAIPPLFAGAHPITTPYLLEALPALAGVTIKSSAVFVLLWDRHASRFFEQITSGHRQAAAQRQLLKNKISIAVFADGVHPPVTVAAALRSRRIPWFAINLSGSELRRQAENFLFGRLAARRMVHGTLLTVYGSGLLLTGKSGIGKSESALDLVQRGHQLIADDAVLVYRDAGTLIGMPNPILKHHLEVRGIGIVDIAALFGARAIGFLQQIHAVVELVAWSPLGAYERSGLKDKKVLIAGVALPQIIIPLSSSRTAASFIEAIALNTRLLCAGINCADAFNRKLISTMQTHG